MLSNYLKIAFRSLIKGKVFTVINLSGLSIATSVVILLALYIHDEWTFDSFHSNQERIYRVWVKEYTGNNVFFNTVTPYILGQELRDNVPDIEEVVRYTMLSTQVKKGEFIEAERVHLVEPQFFKVFDFTLVRGKTEGVLRELHSIVLTEDMGVKYFSDPHPVGQTLTIQIGGNWVDYLVTGIIEKAPGNSSIQYDFLIPFENTKSYMSEGAMKSWTNVNVETYLLLNEKNDPGNLQAQIAPFIDKKVAADYEPGKYLVGLQSLADIHLNNDYPEGFLAVSDSSYPYILCAIAILILALACINFTTLAVGRSLRRAKEVGIRKATGATRGQLMVQFWTEALVTAAFGVILGAVTAKLILPVFNQVADKNLTIILSANYFVLIILLALVTGIFSGVYPAAILSGFSPIRTLRSVMTKVGSNRHLVLKGLVGFQFVISTLLIIATIVLVQQIHFIRDKNLGFSKEEVVVLPYSRSGVRLSEQWKEGRTILERLRSELSGNPAFQDFAFSTHVFGTPAWSKVGYTDARSKQFRTFNLLGVDAGFLPLYGIDLADGRNFFNTTEPEQRSVLVNQTFAELFDVAVGQPMPDPFQDYVVIGITADFNFESLHNEVQPLLMTTEPLGILQTASDVNFGDNPTSKISVKISGENITTIMSSLQLAWKLVAPEQPFNYSFTDDNLERQYRAEERLTQLINISTMFAIFIACLGLFGIATLTISQRTREIGIRKVLGATRTGIVFLVSREFLVLVIAALVIASPLAYYLLEKFLSDFAYRIDIQWSVFLVAGLIAVAIAWSTIIFQSLRASNANPVKSLRSE